MKIKNYITCLIKKLISLTKFFHKDKSTSIKLKELLLKKHLKLTFGDQKGQVDFLINNVLNYKKNDYRQVAHLMYDVIYVHKDFLDEVNFDPHIKFAFTPRKNW